MSCHSGDAGGSPGDHFTLYKNSSGNGKSPEACRTECYHDDDCLAFETGPGWRCEIWTHPDYPNSGGTVRVGHTTSNNYACYIKLDHIDGSPWDQTLYPDCND